MKNYSPLITIGIPFYNAQEFLSLSISSVLKQSYIDFELILSDDGSTDNSLQVAKSFNDKRIKIISDGKNRGIAYRLNEQIEMSKGKYFARMDADDIMFPQRIEKQVEFLENNHFCDVVGSYAAVIDNKNQIIGLRKSVIPSNIYNCFKTVPFIHPTVMGKISWFQKNKYIEEMKGVEDADLWIRSFNYSKFEIITEPLMFYRDPLKLNYRTYKYRMLLREKLYISNQHLLDNSQNITILKITDKMKLFLYWLFRFLNLEGTLVKRRNYTIDKDIEDKYLSIIESIHQ